MGYTIKMVDSYTFKTGKVLADYASFFISIKDQATIDGDKALRTVAKLCTNSLYGKFGSKYLINTTVFTDSKGFDKLCEMYDINSFFYLDSDTLIVNHSTELLPNAKGSPDSLKSSYKNIFKVLNNSKTNPALSAAIASLARIKLYNAAMLEVSSMGGELIYVDTDSVFA